MADFHLKSAIGIRRACFGRRPKHGTGAGGRQNVRVANELCHTKRRINADELARIT